MKFCIYVVLSKSNRSDGIMARSNSCRTKLRAAALLSYTRSPFINRAHDIKLNSLLRTPRCANSSFTSGREKRSVPDTLKCPMSRIVSSLLITSASWLELTTMAVVDSGKLLPNMLANCTQSRTSCSYVSLHIIFSSLPKMSCGRSLPTSGNSDGSIFSTSAA